MVSQGGGCGEPIAFQPGQQEQNFISKYINKKISNFILKMDKGSEQTFLHKRYMVSEQEHENMISIISHHGNANQSHLEIPFHTH